MSKNNVIGFPVARRVPRPSQEAPYGTPVADVVDFEERRSGLHGGVQDSANRPLTEDEVWEALKFGRLQVHYQPQFDIGTAEVIAAEALVRLVDTDSSLIYPDRFIEMVEQSDLIIPLGHAVIEQVCADLAICRAQGVPLPRVSINLSARQVNADKMLADFIDEALRRHCLEYVDLEFELTERQYLTKDCRGLSVLRELAERGSRIVIDDFGIGYSSVLYLTELPICGFKLDRALVSRLPDNEALCSVVKSLLCLADDLRLDVVAEGVESPEQHDFLTQEGCPYAQGFGFARPMSFDKLRALLCNGEVAGLYLA